MGRKIKNDPNQGRLPISRKCEEAADGHPSADEAGAGVPKNAIGSAVRNQASYSTSIKCVPPDARIRRCNRCGEAIVILKLKDGRTIPFNADGSGGHSHDAKKPPIDDSDRVIFQPAYGSVPQPAGCGCENALGIPTKGGEIRFNRVVWRWDLHKCGRTLESLDSGIEILAHRASHWDVEPVLCLIGGVLQTGLPPQTYLIRIITVTKEKHISLVEATSPPLLGSLAAWYANGDRKGILTSDGKWFDWQTDWRPA